MPSRELPGLPHERIETAHVRRSWCVADGLATTVYQFRLRPDGPWLDVFYWRDWYPFDAIVTVDGIDLPVSRLTPNAHNASMAGAFVVAGVERTRAADREGIRFTLRSVENVPRIEVVFQWETLLAQPLARAWVEIVNRGDAPCRVDRIRMEPYNDRRVEVEYMAMAHDVAYGSDARTIGSICPATVAPLGRVLRPGDRMEGFPLLVGFALSDPRSRAVIRQDLVHAFAPHTRQPLIMHQMECANRETMLRAVEAAGEAGIEMLMLRGLPRGQLVLREDLFPGGEEDLRRLCRMAGERGVKIGFYIGMCIHEPGEEPVRRHPDWQFLRADGRRYDPHGDGNMCPGSPWGACVLAFSKRLVELGVRGLQTDGPPYQQECHEAAHGHASPDSARIENWEWEREFNRTLASLGVYLQSPQNPKVLFDGVAQICGGYTEEDQIALRGMEQVVQFRANLTSNLQQRGWSGGAFPASCQWGFLSMEGFIGRESMVGDPESNPVLYEHALATHLGLGFGGCLFGDRLSNGPHSRAILAKWIGFFKKYRRIHTCRNLVLRTATGNALDGVLHACPDGEPGAVAVVFNPLDRPLRGQFALPMEFAGWKAGQAGVVLRGGEGQPRAVTADAQAQIVLEVEMPPDAVAWWEVRRDDLPGRLARNQGGEHLG